LDWPLKIYFLYFIILFVTSSIQNRSLVIGYLSIVAVWKQFFGYGIGFLTSYYKISVLGKQPQEAFPELFFKVSDVEDNYERSLFNINNQNKAPIHKSVEKAIDKIINPIQKLVEPVALKSKIIGLTGGIGSGKTAVANYIQSKGIPVYVSDLEAKKVMESPEIISQIAAAFGIEVIGANNALDREKLASIVFNDAEKLKQLNAIVHPSVKKHFDSWIIQHNKYPIIIKEAAILFESGSYKDCDSIITVSAPLETRIQRVLERDKTTREKILQRINNQLSDEERIERSQFVVKNVNFDETKIQIDEILSLLKNK
jgi:dephospho-CoA kinase